MMPFKRSKDEDGAPCFDAKNCSREWSIVSIIYERNTVQNRSCYEIGTKPVVPAMVVTRPNPTRHPAPFPALQEPPLLGIIVRLWPCFGAAGEPLPQRCRRCHMTFLTKIFVPTRNRGRTRLADARSSVPPLSLSSRLRPFRR